MDERAGTLAQPRSAEPPTPYLARWDDRGGQQRWPMTGRAVIVGRAPQADVTVDGDPLVSRVHACLELVAGVWTVADDGLSRNGTWLNGRRVCGRVPLHDRDELRVGSTVLRFCAPAEDAGSPTVVGQPLFAAVRVTASQREVLVALCRPYADREPWASPATNQQIADELCLSVDAVKTHLRGLFHRFGLDDLPQNAKRAKLAELALRHGLVSPAEL